MSERVKPRNHFSKGSDQFADQFLWSAGNLAETDQALVGAHLYQHDLIALHALMRRPAWLSVRHRHRMGMNLSDLHDVRLLRGDNKLASCRRVGERQSSTHFSDKPGCSLRRTPAPTI